MESAAANSAEDSAGIESRARSTIEFVYLDLDNSIEVIKAVRNLGGIACEWTQLAATMNLASDGGGFRARLFTARTYGLLKYGSGQIDLTDLGIHIVDPLHSKKAKAEAFLCVPLHKALFEKLKGQPLPSPAAVERMIEQLGVAPKQKDKARQVFMRAARQAGYFSISSDRLTPPPGLNLSSKTPPTGVPDDDPSGDMNQGGGGGGVGGDGGGGSSPGRLRFEVPIPGKPSALVMVPDDLDADDWAMLSSMMTTYIERWKRFTKPANAAQNTIIGDGRGPSAP